VVSGEELAQLDAGLVLTAIALRSARAEQARQTRLVRLVAACDGDRAQALRILAELDRLGA
jgi:hypothetical protein